jgi:leader peptidase (prepilin peptidase)/N-methyltransferase
MIANFIFMTILFAVLAIASFIDYKTRIIPPILPIILTILGFAFSILKALTLSESLWIALWNSLLGFLIGGLFLFAAAILGRLILKKETMGGGDIKLMAGAGACLYWERVLLADILAFFIAAFVGLVLILCKKIDRKTYIPFVPFLAGGVYIAALLPQKTIDGYILMWIAL